MIDRRKFLSTMIGGIAASAAVRTFPFRVFSFPSAPRIVEIDWLNSTVMIDGMQWSFEMFAMYKTHMDKAVWQAFAVPKGFLAPRVDYKNASRMHRAGIAQLAEHPIRNRIVGGSSPLLGSNL